MYLIHLKYLEVMIGVLGGFVWSSAIMFTSQFWGSICLQVWLSTRTAENSSVEVAGTAVLAACKRNEELWQSFDVDQRLVAQKSPDAEIRFTSINHNSCNSWSLNRVESCWIRFLENSLNGSFWCHDRSGPGVWSFCKCSICDVQPMWLPSQRLSWPVERPLAWHSDLETTKIPWWTVKPIGSMGFHVPNLICPSSFLSSKKQKMILLE